MPCIRVHVCWAFVLFLICGLPAAAQTVAAAAEKAGAPPGYRVGPNDLLQISVYDFPDLSRDVRVAENGSISFPFIPDPIPAAERTPKELEQSIANALRARGIVNVPQVTVFIKEYRARVVTLVGAVKAPMAYQLMGPTPLLELISRAGGLADDAAEDITVSSAGVPRRIAAKDLLDGDAATNLLLEGGETVHVPRAGIVYVVGAVKRPGGFVLRAQQPLTVVKALALAEDVKPTAAQNKAVIVRTLDGQNKQEIPIDLKRIMARKSDDPVLQANDVLFIPDSSGKKAIFRGIESVIGIGSSLVVYRGW